MTYLENSKQYTGSDLENIFFRPMLTGESAQDLGVRVLYNMPQPTHVQLWDGQRNILQKFTSAGWAGGKAATKYEKTVNLNRVKAELGFSAANYFSMVYEKVSSLVNTHMDDLSGTELEQAETALFKQALAENIRVTMWIGDTSAASGYNTFDGLLKRINGLVDDDGVYNFSYQAAALEDPAYVVELFDKLWNKSDLRVQDLKADGQLAFFVTSDLCHLYEKYLDSKGADAAYTDTVNGIKNALAADLNVSLNTPLCSLNRDYLSVVRFAHELGVRYLTCSGLIPAGNAENDASRAVRLTPAELDSIPEARKSYPEFSQFRELPAWGFYIRHAKNITMDNVQLIAQKPDYRPAIVLDDVHGIKFDNVTYTEPGAEKKQQLFPYQSTEVTVNQ